ncbi:MAG: hypothetical protein ACR2NN_18480 [Bryobacteraceae bacterium]
MKPENYSESNVDVDGWQVHLTTYQLGEKFHCTVDNVSPGANLARVVGDSREDAEAKALRRAKELLSRTKRRAV